MSEMHSEAWAALDAAAMPAGVVPMQPQAAAHDAVPQGPALNSADSTSRSDGPACTSQQDCVLRHSLGDPALMLEDVPERPQQATSWRDNFTRPAWLALDGEGHIQRANQTAASLTGYRRRELYNLPIAMLIAPSHRQAFSDWFAPIRTTDTSAIHTFPGHIVAQRHDGSEFYAHLRVATVRTAELSGIFVELSDITAERQQEIELAVSTRLLALLDEVNPLDQLGASLSAAAIPDLADAIVMTCYPYGCPPIVSVAHQDVDRRAELRDTCLEAIRQRKIVEPIALAELDLSDAEESGDGLTDPASDLAVTLENRFRAAGLHTVIRVPLRIDGSPDDAIWFAMEQANRHFLPGDERIMANIADESERFLCHALTIEDARHAREAAERARHRVVNIHALTAAFNQVALPVELAEVMTTLGARLLGVNGVVVSRLTEASHALELLGAGGCATQALHVWKQPTFLSQSPAGTALTVRRPVWLRTPREILQWYPALTEVAPTAQAWVALPLVSRGQSVGALLLSYSQAQAFDPNERALLTGIAERLSEALMRAEWLESERRARQHAEGRAELQHQTLVHVANGVMAADKRGRLTFANPAVYRLLGLTPEELASPQALWYGQSVFQRRDGTMRSARQLLRAASQGEEPEPGEWTVMRNGQPRATVEAITEPIVDADQRRLGTVLTLRDVTADRERAHQQDERIADLIHDLRTPLAAIKASIGVVLANIPGNMPKSLRHLLENVDMASDRLAALLELPWQYESQSSLQRRRVDLRAVVMRAVRTIEPLAAERGQSVSLYLPQSPVAVRVDPIQIERGLLNLLANAQKYGRERGNLSVRLDVSTDEVIITVADDGEGIPSKDQRRIFDRYVQSEASGGSLLQGFGLGLAITRSIAEAHGGRVTVESAPNHGTTFRLSLPLDVGEAPQEIRP